MRTIIITQRCTSCTILLQAHFLEYSFTNHEKKIQIWWRPLFNLSSGRLFLPWKFRFKKLFSPFRLLHTDANIVGRNQVCLDKLTTERIWDKLGIHFGLRDAALLEHFFRQIRTLIYWKICEMKTASFPDILLLVHIEREVRLILANLLCSEPDQLLNCLGSWTEIGSGHPSPFRFDRYGSEWYDD